MFRPTSWNVSSTWSVNWRRSCEFFVACDTFLSLLKKNLLHCSIHLECKLEGGGVVTCFELIVALGSVSFGSTAPTGWNIRKRCLFLRSSGRLVPANRDIGKRGLFLHSSGCALSHLAESVERGCFFYILRVAYSIHMEYKEEYVGSGSSGCTLKPSTWNQLEE